ncbi:MAG: ABC transporter permease, partial [Luteimonas sp.]
MNAAAVWQEIRQSWRGLLRRPGYLSLAMATLALGVATTTAVFSLIDQALLKPLPFPDAERLVTVGQYVDGMRNVAAPAYLTPTRAMRSFESAGMVRGWAMDANIARGDQAEVVRSIRADRGFLDTLALPLASGRNFSVEEDTPNGAEAVILSHAYWQRAYGGDRAALGSTLQVEGRNAEVIGVLPASFQWWERFDVILPLQQVADSTRMSTNETLVARLAPGVAMSGASAEVAAVIGRLIRDDARDPQDARLRRHLDAFPPDALPIKSALFSTRSGNTLWLFSAAAGCVLLIAAINLASLMLLRALGRSHDHAVRLALGASWRRLGVPMLAEGALIGVLGSALGVLLAWCGLRMFAAAVPLEWMRGETPGLSQGSVMFAVCCGIATACFAALLGVWRTRRLQLSAELVGGGRGGWSLGSGRLGKALVVTQVAVAVVLLTGAGLFMRTLQELSNVPLGVETRMTSIFSLSPVKGRVETADAAHVQA